MQRLRMVPLVRVGNAFHARVLAARLGSEGIVTQLRGAIDTPYPAGAVEVLVEESDLDEARALLLADEVESAFEPGDVDIDDDEIDDEVGGGARDPRRRARRRVATLVAAATAALLVAADVVATVRRR